MDLDPLIRDCCFLSGVNTEMELQFWGYYSLFTESTVKTDKEERVSDAN